MNPNMPADINREKGAKLTIIERCPDCSARFHDDHTSCSKCEEFKPSFVKKKAIESVLKWAQVACETTRGQLHPEETEQYIPSWLPELESALEAIEETLCPPTQ